MAVNGAERRFRYEIACFRLVPKPAVRAIDINPHSPDKAAISGGSAREADQVRREGRQPRPLRHVPNDRGWGATTDGRGNPVADRPVASTGRASMRGRGSDATGDPAKRCALMQSKQPVPPPRCRQMVGSNAVVHAVQDFLLSKTLKRAILASQSPRIRGMLA